MEAPPSQPVLPQSHPLLEASPIRYPETWVNLCRDLKVYGPTVSVVDQEYRLMGDVSVEWGKKSADNWAFRRFSLPPPKKISGRTLVLASTGGNTYFHWIMDVLPRIRLAREAGYDPNSFDHILVNGLDQPFQGETLAHLKISHKKCLYFSDRESAYELDEAVLPSLPGVPGAVPAESVHYLQCLYEGEKSGTTKKIFLGRGDAKHRAMNHEVKIAEELKKRGFQSVDCGRLSVKEQAEFFGSAEVVVGAHGAALTNLVFCRAGATVIELFSPRYVNPCYRDLCLAAGLIHGAVIGDGKDWVVSTKHDEPSAPITTSWELVEKALKAVVGGR